MFWKKTKEGYTLELKVPSDAFDIPVDKNFDGNKSYLGNKVLEYDLAFTRAQIDFSININNSMVALDAATFLFNESVKTAYETRDKAFKEARDNLNGKNPKKQASQRIKEQDKPESPLKKEAIWNYISLLENGMDQYKKPF